MAFAPHALAQFDHDKFILAVEGPVGAGKSTLIECLKTQMAPGMVIYGEVSLVLPDSAPSLESFYQSPGAHANALQQAILEAYSALVLTNPPTSRIVLLDRGITAAICFARSFFKLGFLTKDEYKAIKKKALDLALASGLIPNLVVYIDVAKKLQLARIAQRGRAGEEVITKKWIESLAEGTHHILSKLRRKFGTIVHTIDADHLSPASTAFKVMQALPTRAFDAMHEQWGVARLRPIRHPALVPDILNGGYVFRNANELWLAPGETGTLDAGITPHVRAAPSWRVRGMAGVLHPSITFVEALFVADGRHSIVLRVVNEGTEAATIPAGQPVIEAIGLEDWDAPNPLERERQEALRLQPDDGFFDEGHDPLWLPADDYLFQ